MNYNITEIELKYSPQKGGEHCKINNSYDAYKVFKQHWNFDTIELYEEVKVLLLNNSNEVLGIHTLSKGGISGTVVDLKLMFAMILKSCAVGFIMAHNHPSGNLTPSDADKRLHAKIVKSAKLLDLRFLDDIIITKDNYTVVAS